jgi:hypothetical protein
MVNVAVVVHPQRAHGTVLVVDVTGDVEITLDLNGSIVLQFQETA